MRSRSVPVAGLLVGGVLVAVLAGCGGDEPSGTPSADTRAATPTPVPTVAVSTPGKVQVSAGLPPGFPTEIPLYDAPVIAGAPGEPGSRFDWSVVLQPAGEPVAIAATAAAQLERAGFTGATRVDQPTLQVLEYADGGYVVGVTVAKTGDGVTMTYTVSTR